MIFWYTYRPPPCKLLVLLALSELNVSCFTKYLKISDRICHFFCAYLHGMYDFTRLMRAIVCREIYLCWHFESGFRRRICKKKNYIVYDEKYFFLKRKELKCTPATPSKVPRSQIHYCFRPWGWAAAAATPQTIVLSLDPRNTQSVQIPFVQVRSS